MNPSNISGDIKGFNSRLFKSDRAIRRAFIVLGYSVDPNMLRVPESAIRRFQTDYNVASSRLSSIGSLHISGKINKETLNALEFAIRWSKKRSSVKTTSIAECWRSLIGNKDKRAYSGTDHSPSNFVEVNSDGSGNLRSTKTDSALRCIVLSFEKRGETVFATVSVPPQGDMPEGCKSSITCPCIFLSDDSQNN